MKKLTLAILFTALLPYSALAKVKTQTVEYKQGDTVLQGYLAYDDAKTGKRPGVLIVHDWLGVGDYVKGRAQQLAEMGYVAFAADIYGKGVRPKDNNEAGALAGKYKAGDRKLMRARAQAGLDELKKNPNVDSSKIAAIGYCFGGTTALELARSGAPIAGVVSFHGGLDTPNPKDAQNIHGKVLALHGANDPFVSPEEVAKFEKEMRDAKVDWQLNAYGGAVHGFTMPSAGNDPSKGMAYNAEADRRSFDEMKRFFAEIFR